jgi:hypothetical protein
MATTLDAPPETPTLEAELEHLEQEDNELDDRASTLEFRIILIALLAGVALIFSVAALAVALIRTGGNGNSNSTAAAPVAGTRMGAGMMNGSAGTDQGAAPLVNGAHVINVRIGEMYVSVPRHERSDPASDG